MLAGAIPFLNENQQDDMTGTDATMMVRVSFGL